MSGSQEAQSSNTPKLKRSRNGCNECRRLHRRCDEEKPACLNCREAGKTCSYNKPLSWGGRPFRKSTFGNALGSGVVEIPIGDFEDESTSSRPFVYGQAESSGSTTNLHLNTRLEPRPKSVPIIRDVEQDDNTSASPPGSVPFPSVWIPWLSQHHRMLFHHFIGITIRIFTEDAGIQQDIRSAIIPMAVDTNHGFSLLAAILSLASTHRMNLGLHRDETEIEYWRDMSVGHLRRPMVQEDESAENVFAATALMLCVRDVISEAEKPFSWKLHLQGAFTVLTGNQQDTLPPCGATRLVLRKLAGSLQLRSLQPTSVLLQSPGDVDRRYSRMEGEVLGFPTGLSSVFQDIRALRLEKNALQNIESNSDSSNMQPLWGGLRGQCLDIIVKLRTFSEGISSDGDEEPSIDHLYAHVALLQTYSAILDLPMSDSGLRNTFHTAISTLKDMALESQARISPQLLFPLFTIGCLTRTTEERTMITGPLTRIFKEHGKGNANLAKTFLEELWGRSNEQTASTRQVDVEKMMDEKGWDLSLW